MPQEIVPTLTPHELYAQCASLSSLLMILEITTKNSPFEIIHLSPLTPYDRHIDFKIITPKLSYTILFSTYYTVIKVNSTAQKKARVQLNSDNLPTLIQYRQKYVVYDKSLGIEPSTIAYGWWDEVAQKWHTLTTQDLSSEQSHDLTTISSFLTMTPATFQDWLTEKHDLKVKHPEVLDTFFKKHPPFVSTDDIEQLNPTLDSGSVTLFKDWIQKISYRPFSPIPKKEFSLISLTESYVEIVHHAYLEYTQRLNENQRKSTYEVTLLTTKYLGEALAALLRVDSPFSAQVSQLCEEAIKQCLSESKHIIKDLGPTTKDDVEMDDVKEAIKKCIGACEDWSREVTELQK